MERDNTVANVFIKIIIADENIILGSGHPYNALSFVLVKVVDKASQTQWSLSGCLCI